MQRVSIHGVGLTNRKNLEELRHDGASPYGRPRGSAKAAVTPSHPSEKLPSVRETSEFQKLQQTRSNQLCSSGGHGQPLQEKRAH